MNAKDIKPPKFGIGDKVWATGSTINPAGRIICGTVVGVQFACRDDQYTEDKRGDHAYTVSIGQGREVVCFWKNVFATFEEAVEVSV